LPEDAFAFGLEDDLKVSVDTFSLALGLEDYL